MSVTPHFINGGNAAGGGVASPFLKKRSKRPLLDDEWSEDGDEEEEEEEEEEEGGVALPNRVLTPVSVGPSSSRPSSGPSGQGTSSFLSNARPAPPKPLNMGGGASQKYRPVKKSKGSATESLLQYFSMADAREAERESNRVARQEKQEAEAKTARDADRELMMMLVKAIAKE